jgi:hypothetical protein
VTDSENSKKVPWWTIIDEVADIADWQLATISNIIERMDSGKCCVVSLPRHHGQIWADLLASE